MRKGRRGGRISFRASPKQHDLHGLERDPEIQTEGSVLNIEEIVLELLASVFECVAVFVLNLSPTCNPWPHSVTDAVIGNFFAEPLNKFRALGAWTYKVHVSFEHAPELRNFVETGGAQELANPRDTRIIVGGPGGAGVGFGILAHGAKFVAVEDLPSPANALLAIKNRPGRTELNGERNERKNGQSDNKSDEGYGKVRRAAQHAVEDTEAEAIRKDEPTGIQLVDFDAARDFLQPRRGLFDLDLRQAKSE